MYTGLPPGPDHTYNGPAIHRLPDELLVYIFTTGIVGEFTARDKRPDEYHIKPPWSHACDWVPLMLVCRRWREIGRGTASLWKAIDVYRNTQWLCLALERSQKAALEVHLHCCSTALSAIPLLTQHTQRLRKLLLPELKREDIPQLSQLLSTDMPALEELRMWSPVEFLPGTAPPELSISFRPVHFPKLRYLRLSCMAFPWEPSAVSRLRYLHLNSCHSLDPALPFERFLDVLAGCHELEELRLHRFIATIPHRVPAGFERVSLPRLRKLMVGDKPALVGFFLSWLSLSPQITLCLIGWIDVPVTNHERSFLSLMLPKDRKGLPVLHTATNIKFAGYDTVDIEATSPDASITLKLISYLSLESYVERAVRLLPDLFGGAPVKELDIACGANTVRNRNVWADLFASFPAVWSLHVQPAQAVQPVWYALSGRDFSPLDEGVGQMLCPKLRDLSMESLRWHESAMDYIIASLRRRAMRGLPKLKSLILGFLVDHHDGAEEECRGMMPFYTNHLVTYADKVEWYALGD